MLLICAQFSSQILASELIFKPLFMKHVSLLLPEKVNVAGFDNPHQGLLETNVYLQSQGKPSAFFIEVVGLSDVVYTANGKIAIKSDKTIQNVSKTDVIIIPPVQGDIKEAIQINQLFYPWICKQYSEGAQVLSLCLGAFLLAQTGLLNGKKCVTHWRASAPFQQLFPKVKLLSDKIITDEDGIYTGGGAFSSANLMLYFIEKNVSREAAVYCSKIFQIDSSRENQSPFIIFNKQKNHGDKEILIAQDFIERQFHKGITVSQLSEKTALGRRTFERRFKQATSNTPVQYIQRIRIEAAKKELENHSKTVNEIMYDIGYNDANTFRTVFRKVTGLTPLDYRKKFSNNTKVQ